MVTGLGEAKLKSNLTLCLKIDSVLHPVHMVGLDKYVNQEKNSI